LDKASSLLDAHLERARKAQQQQAETQRHLDVLEANMSKIASMVKVMESLWSDGEQARLWMHGEQGTETMESRLQESPVSIIDKAGRSEAPHSGPEDAGRHSEACKQLFPQSSGDLEREVQTDDMPAWLREAEEQLAAERMLLVADASCAAEQALAKKRQAGLQLAAKRAANRRAAADASRAAELALARQAGLQLAAKRAANRRAAARHAREQVEEAAGRGAVISCKQQRANERAVRATQVALRRKAAVTRLQAGWRRAMARAVAEQLRRARVAGEARGNAVRRELQRWYGLWRAATLVQAVARGWMSRRAHRDVTQVADGGRLDLQAAAAEAARGLEEIMGPSWRQLISDNLDWGRARWLAAQRDSFQRDVWNEAVRPCYLVPD